MGGGPGLRAGTLDMAGRLGRPVTLLLVPEGGDDLDVEALGLGVGNRITRLTCPRFCATLVQGQAMCLGLFQPQPSPQRQSGPLQVGLNSLKGKG
jgi:hypothetical protein